MTLSTKRWKLEPLHDCQKALAVRRDARVDKECLSTEIRRATLLLLVMGFLVVQPVEARSQSLSHSGDSLAAPASTPSGRLELTYVPPTPATKVHNYVFDTFGPYPIVGSAFAAGINQLSNTPPEWKQGAEGFAKRFGSDFSISAAGTTTRYGLAAAFKEDTLYYRCECEGLSRRLRHAVISTLTARHGEHGHRVFSVPALVAPYAGASAAVYGWYPDRFGGKDAFRMGNYSLLGSVGANIVLEFLYGGPHSLISRMHLNNAHGAPGPGPNQ